jgi:hypothetical protein
LITVESVILGLSNSLSYKASHDTTCHHVTNHKAFAHRANDSASINSGILH